MREIHLKDKLIKKFLPPQRLKDGSDYKLSSFVIPFEEHGRHFLFSTLTKQCFEIDESFSPDLIVPFEHIASSEALSALARDAFLVPVDSDETALYVSLSTIMRAFFRQSGYTTYTVLPTFGCNARCVYCYEEGSVPVFMTDETAVQTAEFIARTKKKDSPVLISWFGGEPLMGEKTIDLIVSELKKRDVEFYSTMVTNGSLINDRIVNKMVGDWKLQSLQITFDGSEEDYIKRKRYIRYDDYYHSIMASIALLQSKGVQVHIRCNVDFENIGAAPKLIDDLKNNLAGTENVMLYFAPLNQVKASDEILEMWEKIKKLEPMIAEAGFLSGPHRKPILQARVFRCMADNPYSAVVIHPDGNLVPCLQSGTDSAFGNVRDGITDRAIFDRYASVGPVMEKCRNCVFLPDCTAFPYCKIVEAKCFEQRMETITEYFRSLVAEYDRLGVPIEEGVNPEEMSVEEKAREISE